MMIIKIAQGKSMIKTLVPGVYTQINTNESEYLIQNQSEYNCNIIVVASQPASTTPPDFILESKHGISSNHIEGTCWGKPEGKYGVVVGIVEG